jgi:hypothetical protein
LEDATRYLADEGYGGQAIPLEGGVVRCATCNTETPGAELTIDALYRLDGASDPDDMAAVIALKCPSCGVGASLVLAYGPNASAEDMDVLIALPDPPPPPETN